MNLQNINALQNINNDAQWKNQKTSVASTSESFSHFLQNAIQNVNREQLNAEAMTTKLAAGEIQDIHKVMVAGQKAMVSLQLTLEVRNKVMDAYQEIMRMQI